MPIEIKDVSFLYDEDTPHPVEALSHISLTLYEGQFTAIIGHTGSGKSTLIQHLNALIRPTSGEVLYNGQNIFAPAEGKNRRQRRAARSRMLKMIRQKVGLVFQYPEHQLFEMTVEKDIAFGPKNLGMPEEEIKQRVTESMRMVGLDDSFREKSPFELSGGQKRRVAIAGVLAMKPEFLILDEPTAGLDPVGRDEILGQVKKLQLEQHIAIILVSHSMDDVAHYADRVIAMDNGKVMLDGTPREVFSHAEELEKMGLGVPQVTSLALELKKRGFPIRGTVLTVEEMERILKEMKEEKG